MIASEVDRDRKPFDGRRPGRGRHLMEPGGTASSSPGQRLKSAASAHLASIRASWGPRQNWVPVPIGPSCKIELLSVRVRFRIEIVRGQHGERARLVQ
jgi:hypothetical protein